MENEEFTEKEWFMLGRQSGKATKFMRAVGEFLLKHNRLPRKGEIGVRAVLVNLPCGCGEPSTDKCLCCGHVTCDVCRLEHGRIATEKKKEMRG